LFECSDVFLIELTFLQERRRYLRSLLQAEAAPRRLPRSSRKERSTHSLLPIVPGYTVLVIDTNVLLSSLSMFASLVESNRWTIMVPLPVIMELDGLKSNSGDLGRAADTALAYITSHIRSHSLSLKVQTSKGNYLTNLNVRIEEVNFTSETAERSMDDLILKAAIWHDEHWVDRSALLKAEAPDAGVNPVKVVLLSLDRNLRLKARSRQIPAASEKDLALLLATGT
jgi:protein SMG6